MTEIDRDDHLESSRPPSDQLLVRQIAQHYYGCEPQGLTQLTGRSNSVWRFDIADQAKVLKLSHQPRNLFMQKEVELIGHLRTQPVPLPVIEHVNLGDTLSDRPFLLMASAGEQTVLNVLTTQPSRTAFDLFIEMGRILAQIHAIPISTTGNIVAGGIAPHQPATYWQRALQYVDWAVTQQFLAPAEVELLRSTPPPDVAGTALCHQDYHPAQCVIKDEHITAVVDWQQAWAGNPMIDLAIAHAYLDFYCPPALIKCFFMGYTAQQPLPADYPAQYWPMRMVQALGILQQQSQRGASPAVESLCDRAVQQYRAYGQRWSSA